MIPGAPVNPFDESQPCSLANIWMPHCAQSESVGLPGSSSCSWGPCDVAYGSDNFGGAFSSGNGYPVSAYEWGLGFCIPTAPGCLLPLEGVDNQRLDAAVHKIDRTRLTCAVAFDRLRQVRQAGRFYRGNPDLANSRNDGHDGWTEGSTSSMFPSKIRKGSRATIHVDTDFLRDTSVPLAQLTELLVHEGMHLAFPPHPQNESYPYTTYPYSEAHTCVL